MRTLATLLLTLSLTAPLACAKSPGPDANPPPASDEGAGEGAAEGEGEATDSECDFTADPNKKYVGESPDQCAVIRFACEEGQEYFADDCGCGCQTISG